VSEEEWEVEEVLEDLGEIVKVRWADSYIPKSNLRPVTPPLPPEMPSRSPSPPQAPFEFHWTSETILVFLKI